VYLQEGNDKCTVRGFIIFTVREILGQSDKREGDGQDIEDVDRKLRIRSKPDSKRPHGRYVLS
jgi:hypothetical protein